MKNIATIIDKIESLENDIEKLIANKEWDSATKKVKELAQITKNKKVATYESVILYEQQEYIKAIKILEEAKENHIFDADILINLGYIYFQLNEYEIALENYYKALNFIDAIGKNEILELISIIEEEFINSKKYSQSKIHTIIEYLKRKNTYKLDGRVYPIGKDGISKIRIPQKENTSDEFMLNLYEELRLVTNVEEFNSLVFKTELLKGKRTKDNSEVQCDGNIIIPISKICNDTEITLELNGEKFELGANKLPINQFNYINIPEKGTVKISSNNEIFVGNAINLNNYNVEKPKLVLKIFVDGLSYQYIEEKGLNKLMPNAAKFFKEGFEATNCYTTSEWTLPSKASTNTGMYPHKHRMLHPTFFYEFNNNHKLMAEYFHEEGYFCANISGNWRTTPSIGYYRGFDRMIYKNYSGGFDVKAVIMEAIEHLETFGDINNYLSISIMDLHNVPDELESHLLTQVATKLNNRINLNKKGDTSVLTEFDPMKAIKYGHEIQRVDVYLGILFDYLNKKYKENEIVVVLHSDHGQTFLDKENYLLSDQRLRIPFFMKGKEVPNKTSDELIQITDILPTMLKCSGIDSEMNIDGILPKCFGGSVERKFIFSQAIHPGQTYKVRIKEKNASYFLESKELIQSDLSFSLKGFNSKLVENKSLENFSNKFRLNEYDEFVFENIKDLLV